MIGTHKCNVPTGNYLIKLNKYELKFKHRNFIIPKTRESSNYFSTRHNLNITK